ncbi:MAG: RluA family pseudouridine synthase, partial [Oscillospiraceae bacterium]|nr:RluA family pseudouridine synthase [Oscillospiraceae bacterium]
MDEDLIFIEAKESGERIDALLAHSIPGFSRNAVQRLLDSGSVFLNGKPLKKNYKCLRGDRFEVFLPEPADSELVPQDILLDIRFEDEDVIVVNKPRGMVVHPAPGHADGTLVNALLYHCGSSLSGIGGEKRPGILHRIDKDTSGLLIVAKNDPAHQFLSSQLADRSLSRQYEAIACGSFRDDSGSINKPIGRNPNNRLKMAVTDINARPALTYWSVLTRYHGYTHIRCNLQTG